MSYELNISAITHKRIVNKSVLHVNEFNACMNDSQENNMYKNMYYICMCIMYDVLID